MPTLPQFPPSPLAAPLILPTTAEAVSATFVVAAEYVGATPPISGPTRISLSLTAPPGQAVPGYAEAHVFLVDSQGNAVLIETVAPGWTTQIDIPGTYVVATDGGASPYGVDAHGYTSTPSASA